MSTTKKGKLMASKFNKPQLMNFYSYGPEIGRLLVQYHMAHSLQVCVHVCVRTYMCVCVCVEKKTNDPPPL